jgi:hypothetical protein
MFCFVPMLAGVLTVKILETAVHSGAGTGVAASSFRILRQLIERIEEQDTGRIKVKELYVDIPEAIQKSAKESKHFVVVIVGVIIITLFSTF